MNKTVLITKSSQGLGPTIAESLVKNGCNVIIHYNKKQLQANALVQKLGNEQAIAVHADPKKSKDMNVLIKLATKHFGQIDAVINNDLLVHHDLTSEDNHLEVIDTITKQLLNQFIAQENGSIINLHNSKNEFLNSNKELNSLITNFTNTLASELKDKGIRANSISSMMTEECLLKSTPVRQDITDIVAFLISDNSKNVTGKNITIKNKKYEENKKSH